VFKNVCNLGIAFATAPFLFTAPLYLATQTGIATRSGSENPHAGGYYDSEKHGVRGYQYVPCNDYFGAQYRVQFAGGDLFLLAWSKASPLTECVRYYYASVLGYIESGACGSGLASPGTVRMAVYRIPDIQYHWAAFWDSTKCEEFDLGTLQKRAKGFAFTWALDGGLLPSPDHHYWDVEYAQVKGLCCEGQLIYWYDWPTLTTFADSAYYVVKVSENEFWVKR
jgi:hypothetical protein